MLDRRAPISPVCRAQSPPPALRGAPDLRCAVCGAAGSGVASEWGEVTSNVRAFQTQSFRLWRCAACDSIHAADDVDLEHFYARYPFLELSLDWRLRALYGEQLRRLEAAGLCREHRVLDYGCGSGAFVRFLGAAGYTRTQGFDGYNTRFGDTGVLRGRYDCVLAQDVLEHVAEPRQLLDQLQQLVTPGGLIALGTPNASAIELTRASDYRHALHAPYHRHIFSVGALLAAGRERGWSVVEQYSTQYANTAVPFLNSSFYLFFMRAQDDTLDCLFEPPRVAPLLRRLPEALYWGLTGVYAAEATDIMVIFRSAGARR
jgi:SAM-dependent methyltransferase